MELRRINAGKLGNFPISQAKTVEKTSKKTDFAVAYLQKNPDKVSLSGRTLESEVSMEGEMISYKTWNAAKKLLD